MSTRWDSGLCRCGSGDLCAPGEDVCRGCLRDLEQIEERLVAQAAADLAKHAAKHAEKGTR